MTHKISYISFDPTEHSFLLVQFASKVRKSKNHAKPCFEAYKLCSNIYVSFFSYCQKYYLTTLTGKRHPDINHKTETVFVSLFVSTLQVYQGQNIVIVPCKVYTGVMYIIVHVRHSVWQYSIVAWEFISLYISGGCDYCFLFFFLDGNFFCLCFVLREHRCTCNLGIRGKTYANLNVEGAEKKYCVLFSIAGERFRYCVAFLPFILVRCSPDLRLRSNTFPFPWQFPFVLFIVI